MFALRSREYEAEHERRFVGRYVKTLRSFPVATAHDNNDSNVRAKSSSVLISLEFWRILVDL